MTLEPWDRILNPLSLSHPRSNSFSLCLSHSLTSWAVFHVDCNGTQRSTIHDPTPCTPLKSYPHGHCIGTWSRDCRLKAGFHAALPRHHKISNVRLSQSLSQLLKQLACSVLILRCFHPFLSAVFHTQKSFSGNCGDSGPLSSLRLVPVKRPSPAALPF